MKIKTRQMVGLTRRLPVQSQTHHGIEGDAGRDGFGRQRPLFHDFVDAVVAYAADITAADRRDGVEQRKLGVAAVHNVTAVGLQRLMQDRPLVVFAPCPRR